MKLAALGLATALASTGTCALAQSTGGSSVLSGLLTSP